MHNLMDFEFRSVHFLAEKYVVCS